MRPVREITKRAFTYKVKIGDEKNPEAVHWHTNAEICRVKYGSCDFNINGNDYFATEGDILVINPGVFHQFLYGHGPCAIEITTFNPIFLYNLKISTGDVVQYISAAMLRNRAVDAKLESSFAELAAETDAGETGSIIFRANLLNIYGILLRHFKKEGKNDGAEVSKLIVFQKMLEFISENYTENITLELLAKKFSYSPVYVSTMLHSVTGVNFKYYLDNIRITKATELLAKGEMSVTEIANSVGYNNIRTFNNVFKKVTGMTPSEMKKVKKQLNISAEK